MRALLFLGGAAASAVAATACVGSASSQGRPPRGAIETTAVRYAEARLGLAGVSVLRMLHPTDPHVGDGACAIVEVRTSGGSTRRVIVVHDGDPPAWEGIAVSEKFAWDDFRADSDVDCGLYNAGIPRGVS